MCLQLMLYVKFEFLSSIWYNFYERCQQFLSVLIYQIDYSKSVDQS